jgi:TRAP-type C4-dicarboxylate transport system permease small subunit
MQISGTPLAIPQFFLPAGSFIMMVQFIAEFFKSLRLLKEGDYKSVPEESEALGR